MGIFRNSNDQIHHWFNSDSLFNGAIICAPVKNLSKWKIDTSNLKQHIFLFFSYLCSNTKGREPYLSTKKIDQTCEISPLSEI